MEISKREQNKVQEMEPLQISGSALLHFEDLLANPFIDLFKGPYEDYKKFVQEAISNTFVKDEKLKQYLLNNS